MPDEEQDFDAREFRADRRDIGATLRDERSERATDPNQVQYFEDMGFTSTKPIHDAVMEDEANFLSAVQHQRGLISTAQAQANADKRALDAAKVTDYASLNSHAWTNIDKNTAAKDAWDDREKFPVRVVNGNNVEQTYYLPKSVARELNNDFQGNGTYYSAFVGNGNYLNIDVAIGGSAYGKELHNTIAGYVGDYEDAIYTASYNNTAAANTAGATAWANMYNTGSAQIESAYNTALNGITGTQSSLGQATGQLNTIEDNRAAEWQVLRDEYSDRLKAMGDMWKTTSARMAEDE